LLTRPTTTAQQQPATKPGIVCTREAATGRIVPVTICHSVGEIAQRRDADRQAAEQIPVGKHDALLGR